MLNLKKTFLTVALLSVAASVFAVGAKRFKGSSISAYAEEISTGANLQVSVQADQNPSLRLVVKTPSGTLLIRDMVSSSDNRATMDYSFVVGDVGEYRFYLQTTGSRGSSGPLRVTVHYRNGIYRSEQERLKLPLRSTSFEISPSGAPSSNGSLMGNFLSVFYRSEMTGETEENSFSIFPRKALKLENPDSLTDAGFSKDAHVSHIIESTFENFILPASPKLAFRMREQIEAMYESGHISEFKTNDVIEGNLFVKTIEEYGYALRDTQSVTYSENNDSSDSDSVQEKHLIHDLDAHENDDDSEKTVQSVYELGYAIEGAAETVARFDLGLLPGVGQFLDFCEAVTGKQFCHPDGKELSVTERSMSALGLATGNKKLWEKLEGDGGSDFQKAAKAVAEGREKMGDTGWSLMSTIVGKMTESGDEKEKDREHIFKFLQEHPNSSETQVRESLDTDRASRPQQQESPNPWTSTN